jgi:predicted kinase
MNKSQWSKWSRDIMELVVGAPNPNKVTKQMVPQVLVMVGIPGSGKSTIANELVAMGWERVNQDDLGSRRVCETRMEDALKRGKSVVVDRCNFDISQR